ncbi:MAG: LamB/YcsF family protein [Clostridia bacterium]|nr:LamB/YcsF family protein [Clostridia bacterium]
MQHTVDLNCDLGESFGAYTIGMDAAVIPFITSANIACGYHASDPLVMDKTVALAQQNGIQIGAHPGFPDLMGFGRRNLNASPQEVKAYVQYQLGALAAFAKAHGMRLQHVKPHGAMYNMAAKDEALAQAICEAVASVDDTLILLGLSGSKMLSCAAAMGLKCAKEVFADRAYMPDGALAPRSRPDAMITDEKEAIARVVRMVKEGKVRTVTGEEIAIQADSVCVHGDGEKALIFTQKIREALTAAGIAVAPMREFIK